MPHTRSARKRVQQSEKRRLRNKSVRSTVKTFISKAEDLIQGKDVEVAKLAVVEATSVIDRAVKKGVVHQNNAARRKSRLMKKLNVAISGAATGGT